MTMKIWGETQVEKLQDLKEVYNIPPEVIKGLPASLWYGRDGERYL